MYWPQVSILFPDEEKGSGIRGFRGANIIAFSLFMKELVESVVLVSWHGINLAVDGTWGVWEKVDSMVPFSGWGESSRCLFTEYLFVAKIFWRYEFFRFGFSFPSRLLGKIGGCSRFMDSGFKGMIGVS